MVGSITFIRTRAFVVWLLLGLRPMWGMVKGNLNRGLPCRMDQASCLNVGVKPVLHI